MGPTSPTFSRTAGAVFQVGGAAGVSVRHSSSSRGFVQSVTEDSPVTTWAKMTSLPRYGVRSKVK
ncbi:hypothetical protein [Micromonospora haikouensis]|uniref:hypothetical protein n=1 Tax=Micromonospora haikouensis TaxID=686309 RepID=UPI003D707139